MMRPCKNKPVRPSLPRISYPFWLPWSNTNKWRSYRRWQYLRCRTNRRQIVKCNRARWRSLTLPPTQHRLNKSPWSGGTSPAMLAMRKMVLKRHTHYVYRWWCWGNATLCRMLPTWPSDRCNEINTSNQLTPTLIRLFDTLITPVSFEIHLIRSHKYHWSFRNTKYKLETNNLRVNCAPDDSAQRIPRRIIEPIMKIVKSWKKTHLYQPYFNYTTKIVVVSPSSTKYLVLL